MDKALFKTPPDTKNVLVEIMPHLSNLEAAIIFAGGIAIGYLILCKKYEKEMRKNELKSDQ